FEMPVSRRYCGRCEAAQERAATTYCSSCKQASDPVTNGLCGACHARQTVLDASYMEVETFDILLAAARHWATNGYLLNYWEDAGRFGFIVGEVLGLGQFSIYFMHR